MNAKAINLPALGLLVVLIAAGLIFNATDALGALKSLDKGAVGLVAFAAMMLLIVVGVPIGFAMLGTAVAGFFIVGRANFAETQLSITFIEQGTSFVFVAVPLYFMMGQLVQRTNIAYDLYECVYRWLGRLPGGLAISSVVACGGFGAVSGGSVTAVATMGPMCIPAMRRYNYDDSLATGSVAAAGTLGILIPPSIIMIGYGILTETSIGALFIAGIIPGILMTLGYSATIAIKCMINPELGPVGEKFTMAEKVRSLSKVTPVFLTFIVVIGGIYGGIFTPTEAAGVGVIALLAIALVMRRLNLTNFKESLLKSMHTSAMIFVIIIGGHMMGKFVVLTGLTSGVVDWINAAGLSPLTVMLMISLLFIVLGMVLDVWGMLILTIPFTMPIIMNLGYDPIWFGVYAVVMAELALITPPVGINVYVMAKMAPDVPLTKIFAGVAPFFIFTLFLVALITIFPDIAMWLPRTAGMAL
ncbi:MAG: TRAP transporter large permease [Alphaproteobacteria bacterium]|nr:TRAP transporter large permease [Alphaproteobacteria bacterium]